MKIELNVDTENNEGTDSPWWMIIDPQQNLRKDSDACHAIAGMITGPYFSRVEAENHLRARRYEFGPNTVVYCASGFWSKQYVQAIKLAENNLPSGGEGE